MNASPAIIISGSPIIWATSEPEALHWPILNLPEGVLKIRRRLRSRREMSIFLKFDDRIEQWIPIKANGGLKLEILRAVNKTDQIQ